MPRRDVKGNFAVFWVNIILSTRANKTMSSKSDWILLSVLTFSFMIPAGFARAEDLTVLSHWAEWSDARTRLQRHLNGLAFKFLEQRHEKIKSLHSAADWQSRREEVRSRLHQIIGPFPEKTPLNARVLGVLRKSDYQDELTVTKTGQVEDSLGGESVFSLNRAEAGRLLSQLEVSRQNLSAHLLRVKNEAGRVSGFLRPMTPPELIFRGRYHREGYSVEKMVISGEGKCLLPALFSSLIQDRNFQP